MVIKIQTSEKSNGNKASCYALASYLEKEDIEAEQNAFENGELSMPRKGFFNHEQNGLYKDDVVNAIDKNKKGLGKSDAKFYSISISPSQKEQQHVLKQITGKDIESINDLSTKDLNTYENYLKDYSRNIMNEYASHFKRKGLDNGNQILYFGKIEHYRSYKGTDAEVKNGLAKSGQKKPGLNSHIHLIVSRKDKDMRLKLSPLANEKGHKNNSKLNGKRVQRGFDRSLFNIKSETLFDKQFSYSRNLEEKAEYRIEASKNPISTKIKLEQNQKQKEELQRQLIKEYDKRNSFSDKDKETYHYVESSIQKERNNNKEMSL